MNNDDSAEKAAWHRTLPRKRMAAGWVVQNKAGEFLILKPSHKDYWGLPGGVVESEESPWHACQREVKEELGIDIDPGRLLCVDYCPSQPGLHRKPPVSVLRRGTHVHDYGIHPAQRRWI